MEKKLSSLFGQKIDIPENATQLDFFQMFF